MFVAFIPFSLSLSFSWLVAYCLLLIAISLSPFRPFVLSPFMACLLVACCLLLAAVFPSSIIHFYLLIELLWNYCFYAYKNCTFADCYLNEKNYFD
jgi:hypothetical protein